MLRDDIALYTELSGKDGEHTPIGVIGAYLDGYEKGKERMRGHWEFKKIGVSTFAIVCSECGNVLHEGQNYNNLDSFKQHIQSMLDDKGISIDKFCHECGADMREWDYDCMACAHDGDSNICLECENGSKYLKWRTVK